MLLRLLFIVCLTQITCAQQQTIKGVVFSEGLPLEGATIVAKGSKFRYNYKCFRSVFLKPFEYKES